MSWRRPTRVPAVVGAVLVLGGCGSDPDEPVEEATDGANGLELVGFLPPDAEGYSTVDLTAIRNELDLPADADPVRDSRLAAFVSQTLNGVLAGFPRQDVMDALDLPAATAAASASGIPDGEVSAVASSAAPAQIKQALLGLGFVDRGGVLEGPDGDRAIPVDDKATVEEVGRSTDKADFGTRPHGATAVRLVEGGLLASDSGELLRSLGSETSGLPLSIQGAIEGDATYAFEPSPEADTCIRAQGIATSADGSGVFAFEIDGEPDPQRISGPDPSDLGKPAVDGNQLVVPIDLDEPMSPLDLLSLTFASYKCPK